MHHLRRSITLGCLLALATLGGCSATTAPGESELALARQRWALSNIRSYAYTVARSCFCAPQSLRPVTVTVTNGVVTQQVYADTGEPVGTAIPDFTTIEALFSVVDAAFARRADRVDATYDPVRGVPLSIWIDASFQTADEEFGYSISAFRPR